MEAEFGDYTGKLPVGSVTSTLNSRFRLIQFNFLHQLYYTPSRLHTFKNSISPLCFSLSFRSRRENVLHSMWLCPKGKVLWIQVCKIISQVHGIDFPLNPEICLLGSYTNSNIQHNHAIKLTEMLLTTAEICIALKWKTDIPTGQWI